MKRLAAVALVVAACGDDGGMPVAPDARMIDASTHTVQTVTCPASPAAMVMTTNAVDAYMPNAVTISVNQIVRFQMSGDHDVTPNPLGTTDPGLVVDGGQTKCLQFTQAGTFGFFCTPHGFTGTITVQ